MVTRKQSIKTWDDREGHYPILTVLAEAEAEEGERGTVSTLVRRAIREYLERLGIFNLRDAELRAITIRRNPAELLKAPKLKKPSAKKKGGDV
jgi:hypothetical protein